jgi:hypothetical protein
MEAISDTDASGCAQNFSSRQRVNMTESEKAFA